MKEETAIADCRQWVEQVVVAHNFCPFAKRELRRNAVRFVSDASGDMRMTLEHMLSECAFLDAHQDTETTLLVLSRGFEDFMAYLSLIEHAEDALALNGYEGVYQVASFHPAYCFADSLSDDAANFTNRSPWPMLHLLRESSLDNAIDSYPDVDAIPERNIQKARALGLAYWKNLSQQTP